MAMVALEAGDVHAHYASSARAGTTERAGGVPLAGVSLTLHAGELVCVLGPNGAGKSTLLRVLAGTLAPSRGEVRLLDAASKRSARREVAQAIAVVPQQSEVAWGFPVRAAVAMGRAPHQNGWLKESAEDSRIVKAVLERCDLENLADRSVQDLSGGEQKRVAIARALAQKPRVLLLDEPGAYLDIRHQITLYDLLAERIAQEQLACLVVMHDHNIASQYATRVALARDGRLVAVGSVPEVMTEATLRETFETELYCGTNEETKTPFFVPVRGSRSSRVPAAR